jgi:hypothetical protein
VDLLFWHVPYDLSWRFSELRKKTPARTCPFRAKK